MLEFVGDVINKLDIGPDKSHVGVVEYSNFASVPIHLNAYQMSNTLLNAVAGISYSGGSTNTADGITTCIQQFITTARPKSSGIPRIAIVVTDGQSDSPPDTIAAAQSFHSANILNYAVGIGSVNMEELNAIASDPASQYVHILSAFNIKELQALQESLNNEACTGEYLACTILNIITSIVIFIYVHCQSHHNYPVRICAAGLCVWLCQFVYVCMYVCMYVCVYTLCGQKIDVSSALPFLYYTT